MRVERIELWTTLREEGEPISGWDAPTTIDLAPSGVGDGFTLSALIALPRQPLSVESTFVASSLMWFAGETDRVCDGSSDAAIVWDWDGESYLAVRAVDDPQVDTVALSGLFFREYTSIRYRGAAQRAAPHLLEGTGRGTAAAFQGLVVPREGIGGLPEAIRAIASEVGQSAIRRLYDAVRPVGSLGPSEGDDTLRMARQLDPPAMEPAVVTASGLRYVEVRRGRGSAARPGDAVSFQYSCRLLSGDTVTAADSKRPFRLVIGADRRGVLGLPPGLIGMKPGGTRRIIIPPDLAYGAKAVEGIPPSSTLVCDVWSLMVL